MNFTGKKCPVCDETFTDSDDIVVCPDCGTPYHRTCYKEKGECIFKEKHGLNNEDESSDTEADNSSNENTDKMKKCPRCLHENREDAIFCDKCGFSLTNNFKSTPFAAGVAPIFDPMGGVDPSEEFSDNVTGGDIAKLVQAGTPYYMNVFKRIKDTNGRGKFNFAALIFSGGWLLYRKQYKVGAIITTIVAALMIASMFFSLTMTKDVLDSINASAGISANAGSAEIMQSMDKFVDSYYALKDTDKLLFWMPFMLDAIRYIIGIVLGFIGNKMYYKHCISTIKKIKSADTAAPYAERLQSSGGVNTAVAFSLIICYFIVSYLPYYFL